MHFWSCTAGGTLYTIDVQESAVNCKFNICPSNKINHTKHCKSAKIKKKISLNQSPEISTRLIHRGEQK